MMKNTMVRITALVIDGLAVNLKFIYLTPL